jgi:hypothetical protein
VTETPEQRPARPLEGYRDIGAAEEEGASRASLVRSWLVLAVLVLIYLGWTLTVYFLEPGLR